MQGDWLSSDAIVGANLSWKTLTYSIPPVLLKLILIST